MKILQLVCIAILFFILPTKTSAQETNLNQFVNIVNPLRISPYTKNPEASLMSQYLEVAKRNLPATWLLTYDAMLDAGINSTIKAMDQSQELGLFLEVTESFAKDSGVVYNKTDSWHRANSVFLSGYTQEDRRKLIDRAFEEFKQLFGFYPTSVGAWWVDSYSLNYMQAKYKVTANLTVADQFATDGYQVWGQYWSTPFYPSKFHSGIPAVTLSNKLDVVTIQWASRDPLNGYGRGPASLFSTQDYFTIDLSDDYFQKLIRFYSHKGKNKFGQVTIGLEGDLTPEAYGMQFSRQLDIVSDLVKQDLVDVVTMKDFALWYKDNFPDLTPAQILETDDLLSKKIKTIWYQSPILRAHLTYDYETYETKILDLRFYYDNFEEPYYVSPNRDLDLSINVPSLIDSAGNLQETWIVMKEKFAEVKNDGDGIILKYNNEKWIRLSKDGLIIYGKVNPVPKFLLDRTDVKISKQDDTFIISPQKSWIFSKDGLVFRDLTPQATNFLRVRKVIVAEVLIIITFLISLFLVGKKGLSKIRRIILMVIIFSIVFGGVYYYQLNSRNYFVPQTELDALMRLSSMPAGKVVVFDRVCLQCSFHTSYPPAVFANKRQYVTDISKKAIVYNLGVFTAKTREEARNNLRKLGADYIYVVKFEDYVELVPFSPGDLNLEEIYSNANAKIWRIKKN